MEKREIELLSYFSFDCESSPKILDKKDAIRFAILGVTIGIAIVFPISITSPSFVGIHVDNFYSIFYLSLTYIIYLFFIIALAIKQWEYYFGKPTKKHPKYGIFYRKIKIANKLEYIVDISLCIFGGFLFALTPAPNLIFLGLSIYSLLGFLRCQFTLKRRGKWCKEVLEETRFKLVVKDIIGGWKISHFFYIIYNAFCFLIIQKLNNGLKYPFSLLFMALLIVFHSKITIYSDKLRKIISTSSS